jgi:hypothetical protein
MFAQAVSDDEADGRVVRACTVGVALDVELLEELNGLFDKEARHARIAGEAREGPSVVESQHGAAPAKAFVGAAKVDLADARVQQRAGAHDARLARHEQLALCKQLRCQPTERSARHARQRGGEVGIRYSSECEAVEDRLTDGAGP